MTSGKAGAWRLAIQLTVAVGLLLLLLGRVDWGQMAASAGRLRAAPVVLASLAFLGIALLEVARLRTVLVSLGLSWSELLRLHVVGLFFGNLLPGQLGADLFRVVALRSASGSVIRPLSLLLFLRLVGLVVLVAAALGSIALHGRPVLGSVRWNWGATPQAIAVCALAAAAILAFPRARSRLAGLWRTQRERFLGALSSVGSVQVAILLGLSVLLVVARVLVLYYLVAAVGFALGPAEAVLVVTSAALATMLPISYAGLGVREGVVAFLLTEAAVPYEEALLVALLGRLLMLLLSAYGGFWLLRDLGGRPRGGARLADRPADPPRG